MERRMKGRKERAQEGRRKKGERRRWGRKQKQGRRGREWFKAAFKKRLKPTITREWMLISSPPSVSRVSVLPSVQRAIKHLAPF